MARQLFERWYYEQMPTTATREQMIKRVGQLANVANKRAKTLTTAIAKGRIREDRTALFRYNQAVAKFNRYVGHDWNYISTGKRIYERLTDKRLRSLEKEILRFLESESSTARRAIELESSRNQKIKERYGLDISKYDKDFVAMIFDALHYMEATNTKMQSSDQILTYIAKNVNATTPQRLRKLADILVERNPDSENAYNFRNALYKRVSVRSYHTPHQKSRRKPIEPI